MRKRVGRSRYKQAALTFGDKLFYFWGVMLFLSVVVLYFVRGQALYAFSAVTVLVGMYLYRKSREASVLLAECIYIALVANPNLTVKELAERCYPPKISLGQGAKPGQDHKAEGERKVRDLMRKMCDLEVFSPDTLFDEQSGKLRRRGLVVKPEVESEYDLLQQQGFRIPQAPGVPAPQPTLATNEAKFCGECGAKNKKSNKFCTECGVAFDE